MEEVSLSRCSSKPNHKLSKSSWPVAATGIIVPWFAHLFSIVQLGSPSMTYKTINSKGSVPDCEQIYFRCSYGRKQVWVGEKIPIFPPSLWLLLHPAVDSLAPSHLPNIQWLSQLSARCLMATAKGGHKNTIISIDPFCCCCGDGFECDRKVSASKCKNTLFHKWYPLIARCHNIR